MTFDEIKQIPDLQVNVTPEVEDAFYFLQSLENPLPEPTEDETVEEYEAKLDALVTPSCNAGERIAKLPKDEQSHVLREAGRMIDNIKKYGVACAAWV